MVAPALFAAAFHFGCCVLPSHRCDHRAMPMCQLATHLLQSDSDARRHPASPAAPTAEKTVRRTAPLLPSSRAFAAAAPAAIATTLASSPTFLRSFVTLGALRCDDDVGLQALLAIFRI
jgi:hypothetical protein